MSVINKMLRDLDKRQQGHQLSNVSSNHVQYAAHTTTTPPWLLICGLALVLAGAAVYAYHTFTQATATQATVSDKAAGILPEYSTALIKNSTASVGRTTNHSHAQQAVQTQTSTQAIEYTAGQAGDAQQDVSQANAQIAQQAAAANTDLNTIAYNAAQAPKVDEAGFAQPKLVTRSAVVKPQATSVNDVEIATAMDAEIGYVDSGDDDIANAATDGIETGSVPTADSESRDVETANLATKNIATDFTSPNRNAKTQVVVTSPDKTTVTAASNATASNATASSKATRTSSGEMAVTEVKLTNAQLAQKSFTLATEAEGQGRFSEAIRYFEKSLHFDPATHEARRKLAALHYGQGRYIKAANVLQEGILLFPQHDEFVLLLARVQQAGGQADDALITLALIADTSALARQKWLAQTDIAQQQGQYALAEQAYRQLLQQEPQQGKWWMGLAYALDSQQQFGQARQAYQTALTHRGLSPQAADFIEQRLTQLGDSQ